MCQKTIVNPEGLFRYYDQWVQDNPMPEEYADWKRTIYCNDCERKSTVPFNFLYHKVRLVWLLHK